jgi:hypothetical protein
MKLKRLFLSLSQEEKDKVTAAIVEAGIGIEVGSLVFRDFLKQRMYSLTGNSRLYIKLFRRLDDEQQQRFYTAMVTFDEC